MNNKLGQIVREEDEVMLESLVRSPAFSALLRVTEAYKKQCQSELLSTLETNRMFQVQGRIIGVTAFENLPAIIIEQRARRLKAKEEKEKQEAEYKKRLGADKGERK